MARPPYQVVSGSVCQIRLQSSVFLLWNDIFGKNPSAPLLKSTEDFPKQ